MKFVNILLFTKLANTWSKLSFLKYSIRTKHIKTTNSYTIRTHTCGEITAKNVNQLVTVCGWLQYQRMNQFVILRDAYGMIQACVPEERKDIKSVLDKTPFESVVQITGKVYKRPEEQINKQMLTGEIEVFVDDFKVINPAEKTLPFSIRDYNKANETTRLKYRYLDLRFPTMQRNLRFRSELLMKMREFLVGQAFVEVETPTLFKKTPGGAQEFIVPTHYPGEFYSLVQSPQQLKQLLMIGGIDRYFQLARCYRDESARPDRQPEFTQLDIELSFSNADKVMSLIEDLLMYCWPENCGSLIKPFPRFIYKDVMQTYGTDQPRYISKFPIINLNDSEAKRTVKAIIIPNALENLSPSFLKECLQLNNKYFKDTKLYMNKYINNEDWKIIWDKCQTGIGDNKLKEHGVKENDFIFLTVGPELNSLKLLGKVRLMYINQLRKGDLREDWFDDINKPIWIIDFPLFEEGDEPGSLASPHHPFTSPHPEDLHLLEDQPLSVRGLHYDLVLSGFEIGGGSVRIHDAKLQNFILNNLLKLSTKDLSHLLEALASGAPPHAGIALGIDRLIAIMKGAQSIREVIAFPKTTEGRDHLTGAPTRVSDQDLNIYNIEVVSSKNLKQTRTKSK